jgi:hypothetical protein
MTMPHNPMALMKDKLQDVIRQAREDIVSAHDVRAKILLKTTADLISNLTSVYEEYESNHQGHRTPALRVAIHASTIKRRV